MDKSTHYRQLIQTLLKDYAALLNKAKTENLEVYTHPELRPLTEFATA